MDLNENQWEDYMIEEQWSTDLLRHQRNERNSIFEQVYRCCPVSSLQRPNLENGDKIIMPPSALDRLARMHIEYPMLFELENLSAEKTTHCGVLEFTSDEGIVYLPNWMMENMLLHEGDTVCLKSTSLVKGEFIKLQPHTKDFLDISDPKSILEISLRSYSCLTTGDTIMIPYNNKKYYIDVVETKPATAISIIETDCEVDFAPPLDYIEPEKHLPSPLSDGKNPQVEEESASKTPQFTPFHGSGRRLDGKPSTQSAEKTSSLLKEQPTENKTMSSNRTSGKLVFGSNSKAPPNIQTQPKASLKRRSPESSEKTEPPQFKAFTGKKYSLRD
ncbi:uncharacterized protein [Cicer arietinum]|uniref:Ubiquitin recognition factor in ER-associated degradation protein 1-like n=1 Tax=Cicer arietinum TaxID=3827 RepID=A0A1S3ECK9_CICAR|nr:ubiquitin recognition factor in ER-associated degradation protein 1-like [Cicer arietinum]